MHPVAREALTPEWKYPEQKLLWLLRAALVGMAVHSLGVTPKYTTRSLLVISAIAGLVVSFAFAFIPTRRPRTLSLAQAVTLVAFLAHTAGHAFGLYANVQYYDKFLHFTEAIAMGLIFFALSESTRWAVWDWRKVRPLQVGIYVLCLAVTLGVLWEIVEFSMDTWFHTAEQNGNADTMTDLIADTLGGLLGGIGVGLATWYGQKHGMHKVSEEPKRPVPTRAPTPSEKARASDE